MDISAYVIEKIDEAIEKEWLKVYYQPVVRTLTGGLCSTESLVRWIDPEIGFLAPDKFIKTLEENKLIHKLDSFVVLRVCRDLRARMDAGQPVVPVSVNLSRLDFMLCDMVALIENTAKEYDIPRDYIHIEITESMIVHDEELMRTVIEGFRKAGFEVWMDDFGTGYSSLTLLKDYDFDMLKMDMSFLSSFTEKSKKLIKSVVLMAKSLRIRTVAEGVETEEEVQFLKDTGCGKIQGYYYGKPEPIDDMYRHLEEKGIVVEHRELSRFYETACLHVVPTDVPLEIIEDNGKTFRTLYMNKAYKEQIFRDYPTDEEADRRIYQTNSPLAAKYRKFAELLEKTWQEETFYYTGAGSFLKLKAQVLAEYDGRYIIKGSLTNMSSDQNMLMSEKLDTKLRDLNQLFDVVHLLDLKDNKITPLIGRFKYIDSHLSPDMGMHERFDNYVETRVFPSDKERYRKFVDTGTLAKRIDATGRGYIFMLFTAMQEDGAYRPEEVYILPVSGSGGNEFLYCMKQCQTGDI